MPKFSSPSKRRISQLQHHLFPRGQKKLGHLQTSPISFIPKQEGQNQEKSMGIKQGWQRNLDAVPYSTRAWMQSNQWDQGFVREKSLVSAIQANLMEAELPQLNTEYSRQAAVLLPFFYDEQGEMQIVLTQRASRLNKHGGEIALPGGMKDDTDASLEECALRETHEECGIDSDSFQLIGRLEQVVSLHKVLVTPYVSYIPDPEKIKPHLNKSEVDSLFSVPVRDLLHQKHFSPERNVIMNGIYHKTNSFIKHEEEQSIQNIFQMSQEEQREFKIWGLSLSILLRFCALGMNVDDSLWIETIDKHKYHTWMKQAQQLRD